MTQTSVRPSETSCACEIPCATSSMMSVTRRTALGAGLVAGAALITACGSGSTAATTTTPAAAGSGATTSSSSTSKTATSTTSSSAATTSASSASPSAGGVPSGAKIAKLADIPDGGSLVVANGTQQIALAKKADGTVVAHTAVCTHQGCTVKASGAVLACPCHGSAFEALTGAVTSGPAKSPLAEIAVEIDKESVYLKA